LVIYELSNFVSLYRRGDEDKKDAYGKESGVPCKR
jgi:hypothetical protein